MVHFPNEIWLGVANYLKLPTDVCSYKNEALSKDEKVTQQTLISLCLVSKQFRAIFQPQLYYNFIKNKSSTAQERLLSPESEWQHKYYQQDERSFRAIRKQTKLESFLITIIHRADLAAMVEHLRIGSYPDDVTLPRYLQKLYEEVPLHKATSCMLVDALRSFKGFDRLRNHFRKSWEESLRDGGEGAEVALLLTLLPNLLSLRLKPTTGSINFFVQELCNTILGPHPKSWTLIPIQGELCKHPSEVQLRSQQPPEILPVLASLSIWSDGGFPVSMQDCRSLLSLPCLKTFRGRGLNVHRISRQPRPGLISLQHLQFIRCQFTESGLPNLLENCTRLRSLEVNTKFAFNPWFAGIVTIHTLQLAQTADTLEHLTLMMPEYDKAMHLDLRSFNRLRHLQVDMDFLSTSLGALNMHEMLSMSMEKLIIRRAHAGIKPHLEKLLDTFTTTRQFLSLLVIKLYVLEDDYEELRAELDDFNKRAQKLQLECKVKEEPNHNHSWWWYGNPESDSDLDSDQEDDSDGENSVEDDSDGED
ncbi:hypothetical protein KCU77_g8968, partial [Aureobasidium melanogenum]